MKSVDTLVPHLAYILQRGEERVPWSLFCEALGPVIGREALRSRARTYKGNFENAPKLTVDDVLAVAHVLRKRVQPRHVLKFRLGSPNFNAKLILRNINQNQDYTLYFDVNSLDFEEMPATLPPVGVERQHLIMNLTRNVDNYARAIDYKTALPKVLRRRIREPIVISLCSGEIKATLYLTSML